MNFKIYEYLEGDSYDQTAKIFMFSRPIHTYFREDEKKS